jgi:hypothetical protein
MKGPLRGLTVEKQVFLAFGLNCKSLTVMAEFKAHMLERFIG